jgi:serine/threonine protein kinase
VFSREFVVHCKLNHPCVVPIYGFSAATAQSETALTMKYMENGSLMNVLERVKAGNQPGTSAGRPGWQPERQGLRGRRQQPYLGGKTLHRM